MWGWMFPFVSLVVRKENRPIPLDMVQLMPLVLLIVLDFVSKSLVQAYMVGPALYTFLLSRGLSQRYRTWKQHHTSSKQLCLLFFRQFIFWYLPQMQYKNPHVQIVTLRNLTPSPFITCYFGKICSYILLFYHSVAFYS